MACVNGSNTVRVKAQRVVVSGTLVVTPTGNQGFKTTLTNETVQVTGLNIAASGIPGSIINLLSLDTLAGYIISKAAPLAMEPMMNSALGGLAGPQSVDMMGKTLTMEVDPSTIDIDASGALITLNTKMLISGTQTSPGFIYTDNGIPSMNPGNGFQLGLADDLANEMMAKLRDRPHEPQHAGRRRHVRQHRDLDEPPPMISADPADGQLKGHPR
ncbi:MAG: hypothetical protein IPQ07_20715 [Myxococcales bacterium]|nr:hypothetical protein [Myxococcales bacterium]